MFSIEYIGGRVYRAKKKTKKSVLAIQNAPLPMGVANRKKAKHNKN